MDRRTDGQTDGGDNNIPNAFSKKRGDKKVNLFTSCINMILNSLSVYP